MQTYGLDEMDVDVSAGPLQAAPVQTYGLDEMSVDTGQPVPEQTYGLCETGVEVGVTSMHAGPVAAPGQT